MLVTKNRWLGLEGSEAHFYRDCRLTVVIRRGATSADELAAHLRWGEL